MMLAFEDELLVLCSRTSIDEQARARAFDLLKRSLDWNYILEASVQHAVAPLLYLGLTTLCGDDRLLSFVPAHIAAELKALYVGNQARNRRLYRVIGEVACAFRKAGLDLLGLKDLQLARDVYPDPGLRPMGDIDLLIRREQYDEAAHCLAELGFHPLPSADIPFTLKYAWAHHFRRDQDNVWLDVQWGVMQREWDTCHEGNFPFEIERIWRGAELLPIDDYAILVPRPEDMLFHLCVHLEGHHYSELILFCDIAEWLRHYREKVDWNYLIQITKAYESSSSVYYVLKLVRELFGSPVPERVLEELNPSYFKASLFGPLFEHLTPLHIGLDELRSSAFPPFALLQTCEIEARRQTVTAQQVFRELNELASEFTSAEGHLLIFDGRPSPKIFPDQAIDSFDTLDLLLLEEQMPRFVEILRRRDFEVSSEAPGSYRLRKSWRAHTADPLLAERGVSLFIEGSTQRAGADPAGDNAQSKSQIALSLLKSKLPFRAAPAAHNGLTVRIIALGPEEMLLHLGARCGSHSREQLFALYRLLEFFRFHTQPINWDTIRRSLAGNDQQSQIRAGLASVAGMHGIQIPPDLLTPGEAPRMFQAARYDLEQTSRYTSFKKGFFFCFTFLSTRGVAAKARYVASYLLHRAALPQLLLALIRVSVSRLRPRPLSVRRFAYWIEPVPSAGSQRTSARTP